MKEQANYLPFRFLRSMETSFEQLEELVKEDPEINTFLNQHKETFFDSAAKHYRKNMAKGTYRNHWIDDKRENMQSLVLGFMEVLASKHPHDFPWGAVHEKRQAFIFTNGTSLGQEEETSPTMSRNT